MKRFLFSGVIIIVLISLISCTFIIKETEQVVITQFGNPVRIITDSGLALKLPFIEEVNVFSKQLLDYDSSPDEIFTKDKKTLVVDNYAKWRIIDPQLFLETVKTESLAQQRLDDIIYSILREELGKYYFSDIINKHRTEIMVSVTEKSNSKANEFGIQVVDVRIKRADLPQENETAVFNRMTSERDRIASQYLSEGEAEAIKIKAATDREITELLSTSYAKAESIRGEGDAQAAKIYAQMYEADPEFYRFYKAMEALKNTMSNKTTLFLPHDSELAQFLLGK